MKKIFCILAIFSFSPLNADESLESLPEEKRLEQIRLLIDADQDQKAIKELEAMIASNPKGAEAYARLGALYALKLKQPGKGIPLFEKSWELGNAKALEGLAMSFLISGNSDGILGYKDDFLNNFEKLEGARFVGFYIASADKDKALFLDLLGKITLEDIQKDDLMAKTIARAAKVTLTQ